MIPHTYPSKLNSSNQTQMVVYVLPSVTGLTRWIDYIPVKPPASINTSFANTFAAQGYILVDSLTAPNGQAWKDYIPVFVDYEATIPYSTDATGYVPMDAFQVLNLFAQSEQGVWFDPSDVNVNWRRNLLTYTEQFDNAVWVKAANVTITANTVLAPDGTLSGDTINWESASLNVGVYQGFNVGNNNTNTRSIWVKSDVAGGTVVLGNPYYSATNLTHTLTTDWQRISIAQTPPSGNFDGISIRKTASSPNQIYIWGAQLEVGASPTSYQRIVTPEISYLDVQPQPVLYQDSAGTTPVTAIEQPVGLMLDKSKGLPNNPELITNGNFVTDTNWTKQGTVTISGGTANFDGVTSLAGNVVLLKSTDTIAIQSGKLYEVNYTIIGGTTNSISVGFGSSLPGTTRNAAGTYKDYILATSSNLYLEVLTRISTGVRTGSIDNISVKEVNGNHAFQATPTSRPVLRARYNLLTYSEQFGNAAWLPVNATKTANALTAPNGTVTAGKLIANTASAVSHSLLITSGATLNVQYTYSVYVKESGYTNIQLFGDSSGNFTVTFNLITVTAAFGGDAISATITDVGDGWFRCTAVFTMKSNSRLNIQGFPTGATASNFGNTFTGDGTSGIYIWGADLRVANDALNQPAYQRIAAATDYDTVGFLPYLQFDGTDDSMATNSIDFTGTDKMTVWAGVRKLSDAARGMLIENSATIASNNGVFNITAPTSSLIGYEFASRGTGVATATNSTVSAPITNVISGISSISTDVCLLRANGSQIASASTDQGTGNYGNYPLYIGRRGGTTLPFNGRLYGLIVRGAQSTNAEITNTETWVNSKTGAWS